MSIEEGFCDFGTDFINDFHEWWNVRVNLLRKVMNINVFIDIIIQDIFELKYGYGRTVGVVGKIFIGWSEPLKYFVLKTGWWVRSDADLCLFCEVVARNRSCWVYNTYSDVVCFERRGVWKVSFDCFLFYCSRSLVLTWGIGRGSLSMVSEREIGLLMLRKVSRVLGCVKW